MEEKKPAFKIHNLKIENRKSFSMTGVKNVESMTQEQYRKVAVDAVKKLSSDVGIPADLKSIAKEEDIPFLAESALNDACTPGNPKDVTLEDIIALYKSLM